MEEKIYTPIEQGTLQARLIWDNDAATDGIEISLLRGNGQEDVLCVISAGENGLLYDIALPLADMDENAVMKVEHDEDAGVLYLKSEKDRDYSDGSNERSTD